MKTSEIISFLDATFHPEYQEDYDNAGFLFGNPQQEICGVMVALDLTPEVIDEAIAKQCNLIITHHPFIFGSIKRITTNNTVGRMIFKMAQHNLCVYAAHTNLDNLKEGVNGILAQKLGLTDCHILKSLNGDPEVGAGMVGMLPKRIATEDFWVNVKQTLGIATLRISNPCHTEVQRVAICGGAGSFLISDAIATKADVFLTGDLKYHDFQRAENRIILADIGHYESERFSKELIYSIISKNFSNFACFIAAVDSGFVRYI